MENCFLRIVKPQPHIRTSALKNLNTVNTVLALTEMHGTSKDARRRPKTYGKSSRKFQWHSAFQDMSPGFEKFEGKSSPTRAKEDQKSAVSSNATSGEELSSKKKAISPQGKTKSPVKTKHHHRQSPPQKDALDDISLNLGSLSLETPAKTPVYGQKLSPVKLDKENLSPETVSDDQPLTDDETEEDVTIQRRSSQVLRKRLRRSTLAQSYENDEVELDAHLEPLLSLCPPGKRATAQHAAGWASVIGCDDKITKIAEASYSEVYRTSTDFGRPLSARNPVLKVVALEPPSNVRKQASNSDRVYSIERAVGELKGLKQLSSVRGFAQFRGLHILTGGLPKPFVSAWKSYHHEKGNSYFPNPQYRHFLCSEKIYMILEMEDAGGELEKCPPRGYSEALGVLISVAGSLAEAECRYEFEHRDLHVSNVCLRLEGDRYKSTIIDYTLSRLRLEGDAKDEVLWYDVEKDPAIFEGEGLDQFQVYRDMRQLQLEDEDSRIVNWRDYHPVSNVLWLRHLFKMMLSQLESNKSDRSSLQAKQGRGGKKKGQGSPAEAIALLQERFDSSGVRPGFESASDLLGWLRERGDIFECFL